MRTPFDGCRRSPAMTALLLGLCCVLACPLLMGGMMWFMGRDRETARLDREVRRLNRAAAPDRSDASST
jgi:hypothetical protein